MARGEDKLAGIASAIEAEGGKALAVPAEVAKATDIAAAFDKIRRELGEVDALLYNAAMRPFGKLMATKPSNVREYLAGECIRCIYRGAGSGAGDAEKRQWHAYRYRRDGGGEIVSDFDRIRAGQVRAARSGQVMARHLQPQGIHVAYVRTWTARSTCRSSGSDSRN